MGLCTGSVVLVFRFWQDTKLKEALESDSLYCKVYFPGEDIGTKFA
jgi:hypothetical protein